MFPTGIYKAVVKHLGPHGPDGLLAFIFFVGAMGAISSGFDPLVVIVLVVIVYGIYAVRQTLAERHKERSAEIEVERKETDLRILREKQQAKIRKETVRAIPANKERTASRSKTS